MKIIVVANNKGGQGKTTISVLLAINRAMKGKRTLLIDLDPQCNCSRRFLKMEVDPDDPEIIHPPLHPDFNPEEDTDWDGRSSSANFYFKGILQEYPTNIENLYIIPAEATRLLDVERVKKNEILSQVHEIFASTLLDESFTADFDTVIIDTGPSKGPLTTSALYAATHILIPAEMEEMAVEGLYGMLAFWNVHNQQRPAENPLHLIGILPNKFSENVPLHKAYYDSLCNDPTLAHYMFETVMHSWQGYRESVMPGGKPVLQLPPSDRCRQEAEAICQHVEERVYDH